MKSSDSFSVVQSMLIVTLMALLFFTKTGLSATDCLIVSPNFEHAS